MTVSFSLVEARGHRLVTVRSPHAVLAAHNSQFFQVMSFHGRGQYFQPCLGWTGKTSEASQDFIVSHKEVQPVENHIK